jgi:hypothetical protein
LGDYISGYGANQGKPRVLEGLQPLGSRVVLSDNLSSSHYCSSPDAPREGGQRRDHHVLTEKQKIAMVAKFWSWNWPDEMPIF